ncbi:MAG: four helix bundle protein [Chthoniobacteraceae bacterium]
MKPFFDHEKLNVYQVSLRFNAWVGDLLREVIERAAVKDQLDRAATSICLNIAEGNGKFSRKDRARYFDSSRGSALESASCLDVLVSRRLVTDERVAAGKQMLFETVNMLMGLLRRLGYDFDTGEWSAVVREDSPELSESFEQEQEQDKE